MTIRSLLTRLRDLTRREDGTATLDFVLIVPVFITLFVSSFELSVILIRQAMLDRGLDIAVRDLRLGKWPKVTEKILKEAVCDGAGNVIADCENQLLLEMYNVTNAGWQTPDPGANCIDRSQSQNPALSFQPGVENEMILIRACVLIDPFLPGAGLALAMQAQHEDGFPLTATSAFVNEPEGG